MDMFGGKDHSHHITLQSRAKNNLPVKWRGKTSFTKSLASPTSVLPNWVYFITWAPTKVTMGGEKIIRGGVSEGGVALLIKASSNCIHTKKGGQGLIPFLDLIARGKAMLPWRLHPVQQNPDGMLPRLPSSSTSSLTLSSLEYTLIGGEWTCRAHILNCMWLQHKASIQHQRSACERVFCLWYECTSGSLRVVMSSHVMLQFPSKELKIHMLHNTAACSCLQLCNNVLA